jgi:solute:Na+ symporter, SSS family
LDPFVYQYSIGGIVFLAGLYYGFKQGYLGFSGRQLVSLLGLLAGLAAIMGLQGWLEYGDMVEAAAVPYEGEPYVRKKMGAPVDYAIMVGYFVAMLLVGTWFGRGNKSTKDFFFGGQRFSWWLIAFSMVATTIGSYSFVKYSKIAYGFGTASSQTYLNDWLWAPLLIFGWLPLLYFSRIVSIPEYFQRRFGRKQRVVATWLLLTYLIGYVGINLFTMGQALHILLGWDIRVAAVLVATISAIYVTFGGQTSVIMTDLFQGVMLMATGLVLLGLGAAYLGGFGEFWEHLPRGHRTAFPHFNADPSYPAVGIFWQDAMANTAMFYFLNQGMVMRLLAARSVRDSRKAVATVFLLLMPIAAVVVASGGWVADAMVHAGLLDPAVEGKEAFFVAADILAMPGIFGLIMAALTAALMSTVDTLITAIAAITVNDIYKPLRPDAPDAELLKVARFSSVGITLFGVALVPVFMTFDSIYAAHGAFTAAVTPPLVVALLLGVFWRRFTPQAAIWTMVGGSAAIFASILWPEMITPFAQGVPMKEVDPGFLAGKNQYKFMRALFGLFACSAIGVSVTLLTKARPLEAVKGLVWGTVSDAIAVYKGAAGVEDESAWVGAAVVAGDDEVRVGVGDLLPVRLAPDVAAALEADEGALVYVSDPRAWLGGLRSAHARLVGVDASLPAGSVVLGPSLREQLKLDSGGLLRVKRMY